MPQGTITKIQGRGDWVGRDGKQFFSFDVELDGNILGAVNATKQEPWFSVGMVVEYEEAGQTPRGELKLKIRKVGSDFSNQPPQKTNVPAYPKDFVKDTEREKNIRNMWAMKMAVQVKGPQPDLASREELEFCKSLKTLAGCILLALDQMD